MDNSVSTLKCISEIVQNLLQAIEKNKKVSLSKLKYSLSRKYHLSTVPKKCDIIAAIPAEYKDKLIPLLKAKPVRTASGIAVVAVMSKPHRCPHLYTTGAICVYCPGGPDSDFTYSSQSYTGYEPTSLRAIRARYDSFIQAKDRILQFQKLGHSTDKVEYIIMGGTFMSLAPDYRDLFIRNLHDVLSGHISKNIEEAVRYSEQSRQKCIGITIETRPDFCKKKQIQDMLQYGCTRLEIGVQSIFEDIARDTNRGHTVEAVKECFQNSKEAGFKVIAHMMPDLPKMGFERDI